MAGLGAETDASFTVNDMQSVWASLWNLKHKNSADICLRSEC